MRILLAGTALVAVLALGAPAAPAQTSDITIRVATFGGPFGEALQKYAAELFTRHTGTKVDFVYANPSDFLAQLIASRGRQAPFDVVTMDDDNRARAIQSGVLQKLDPAIVTNLKHVRPEMQSKDGYGPVFVSYSFGITYNKAKLQAAGIPEPTSWQDIWDSRLSGHISIPDIAVVLGSDLIIQVARLQGGSEATPEKGIDKLMEIKPHSYYSSSSTVQAQLESGDVWVAPWQSMRSWGLIDRGLPIGYVVPKEGGIGNTDMIDMPVGTAHPKEAQQFINYALDAFAELGMAKLIPEAPSNVLLEPVIAADEEMAKKAPITAAERAKLYLPDWSVYNANLKKVTEQWNRAIHR